MPVHSLENNLLSVDEHTILLVASILVTILDGAETELLALHMESFATGVLQSKDCRIEVWLLSIPKFGVVCTEFRFGLVAIDNICRASCNFFALSVDQIDDHLTAWNRTIQEHISRKETISLCVNGYTLDVLRRFRDYKHRTPDATEVPIVSTALSQINLLVGTFFQHLDLQTILFLSKEHAVRDINSMTGKATLIGTVACLTTINLHMNLRKGSLKYKLNLTALPRFRQRKLRLVQPLLVSNTLRRSLAIEAHTILVGTKTLQFPARRYTYLGPLTCVTPIRALKIPLHHVITPVSTQILALCLHQPLSLDNHRHYQRPYQKNRSSHLSASLFLIKTNTLPFCH